MCHKNYIFSKYLLLEKHKIITQFTELGNLSHYAKHANSQSEYGGGSEYFFFLLVSEREGNEKPTENHCYKSLW